MLQSPGSSASGQLQSAPSTPCSSHIDSSSQGRQINLPTSTASWDPKQLLQPKSRAAEPVKQTQNASLDPVVGSPHFRGGTPGVNNGDSMVFQFASNDGTPANNSGAPSSAASSPRTDHHSQAVRGAGSFIERMNNVHDRSTIHEPKRRKLEEEESSKGDATVQVRSGGGVLGSYVREQQAAGAAESARPAVTVDLTDGKPRRRSGPHRQLLTPERH